LLRIPIFQNRETKLSKNECFAFPVHTVNILLRHLRYNGVVRGWPQLVNSTALLRIFWYSLSLLPSSLLAWPLPLKLPVIGLMAPLHLIAFLASNYLQMARPGAAKILQYAPPQAIASGMPVSSPGAPVLIRVGNQTFVHNCVPQVRFCSTLHILGQ
jgi:hypothetical protein